LTVAGDDLRGFLLRKRKRSQAPVHSAEDGRANGNGNGKRVGRAKVLAKSKSRDLAPPPRPAPQEGFPSREKAILEMIALGRPTPEVLDALARSAEAEADGALCSVLILDDDGKRLRHGAAPSFPDAWREAIDGAPIDPPTCPCSTAAHACKRVISTDIASDPLWAEHRPIAEKMGYRACCVAPIQSREGTVLGTFTLHFREPRAPTAADLELIGLARHLAGIVLERSRADEALRQSEARFRSLMDLSSDWYWEQDENFRFTKMSDAFLRRVGRALDTAAYIGKTRWELPTLNMTHAEWEAHRATIEAHKPYRDFEICRPDRDGNPRYALIAGEPIFDAEGRFRGYRGVGKDITERKREEEVLRLEHTVARCLADAESVSAGLKAVIRALCVSEAWDCGRYWTVDEGSKLLRFGEAWGPPIKAITELIDTSRQFVFEPGSGFAGRVWQAGEPLWIADVERDPRAIYRDSFSKAAIRAAFIFPVIAEGKTIGVVGISCSRVRPPDERLLQSVRVIGSQVGQFLKRKQAEGALRESEERFRSLTELSSDWYWEQDTQYRMTSVAGRYVGKGRATDPEFLIGKRRWETGAKPVQGTWDDHKAVLDSREPFYDFEFRWVDSGGREHFVSSNGRPIFDAAGKFAGYRGMGRDITARKNAEKLLRLEHTVARCLAEADSVSGALQTVMRAVCESQGLEIGVYWRCDGSGNMHYSESWSATGSSIAPMIEAARGAVFAQGEGLVGWVRQSGQPLWAPDVTNDPRVKRTELVKSIGVHGVLLFPVVSEGRLIGVFDFSSRNVREPDERLFETTRVIGSQVGQFLHRKRAEEVLRESEERFRSLTALSSDWYWEQDREFRFTAVAGASPKPIARLLGKTRWELAGVQALTNAEWQAHKDILVARLPFRDFVHPFIDDAGELRYLSIAGEPIFDEGGEFCGYRGTGREVTEAVRREDELRRFRASMDLSGDMIFLIDRDSMRFIDVNETACTLLGYGREELLAMGPHDIQPTTRSEFEQAYDDMIAKGSTRSGMRSYYRRKDGSFLPFEATRRVLRSGERWIIVAISRDTTERIAADEALRRSNERFNLAVRATNDVIWDWDLIVDDLWWNDNLTTVFGYRRDDIGRSATFWKSCIHPDDRERVESGLAHVIGSRGENWSDEYRFRRADGSYAYVFDRGHVVLDNGRPVRMIGALTDITGRKEAEETVRSQALQQRLIAEFGQQALASADLDDVLSHAVELVSVTLKVDYCDVLELNPDGQALTYRAASGWPPEWVGRRVVPIKPGGHLEHVLSSREAVVIEDHGTETRFSPSPLMQFGIRSGMQVPILGSQGAFGVLAVHRFSVHRFSRDDVSFLQSVANILAVAIERKSAEDRLAHLAQFDSLTGLPNRYLFHDRLVQSIAQAKRAAKPMAVLFIDLDRFKLVNDTLGHRAGDQLLAEAAGRLAECVRSGDTVGRFGGDEFGAILSDLTRPADASVVAQKMIDALARPFHLDGQETFVSASVGITLFPTDGDQPEALVMNADTAMYRAKEQGRNTYQYFTREMNERVHQRVQTEAQLRRGLDRGEFLVYYQPKLDLASGSISGFEALLRWQHPERGLVSPMEFIPVMEDTALIVPIGEWVLREVCGQIRAWQHAGLDVPPVAVNLSARQFQHKNLEANLRRILHETGVDPSLLQFELTESLLMKDPESAARTLRGLKDSGVTIAVDDFGTGYSSLAYLQRFPLDALKIDRAFVRDLTVDPEDAAITFAIIGLAHSLKLRVIAEGVETKEQLDLLSAHGCDELQGYYFAYPAAARDCECMLRKAA
jgi:diguanylate cyclase (GGDEF)-like protein/PAS domain S-box-containing protein